MKFFSVILLVIIILGLAGFIFTMQWDPEVPTRQIELSISNERFFDTTH